MNNPLNSTALNPNTSWHGLAFVRPPTLSIWVYWCALALVPMYLLSQHGTAPIEPTSSRLVAITAPAGPADASLPDASEALRGQSAWQAETAPTF